MIHGIRPWFNRPRLRESFWFILIAIVCSCAAFYMSFAYAGILWLYIILMELREVETRTTSDFWEASSHGWREKCTHQMAKNHTLMGERKVLRSGLAFPGGVDYPEYAAAIALTGEDKETE